MGLAVVVTLASPSAKSQPFDVVARCQSIEDMQQRTDCLKTVQKAVSRVVPRAKSSAGQQIARKEPFEGFWARTKAECLYSDGPDSKTVIDLHNLIDQKLTPLFDQYEHHCRVENRVRNGRETILTATCYEFWAHFEKGTDGVRTNIRLSPGMNGSSLTIDGELYQRCEPP
jgi:hypothetical protein